MCGLQEHFGSIGCYGVFASHLFELFELPMKVGNLVTVFIKLDEFCTKDDELFLFELFLFEMMI